MNDMQTAEILIISLFALLAFVTMMTAVFCAMALAEQINNIRIERYVNRSAYEQKPLRTSGRGRQSRNRKAAV